MTLDDLIAAVERHGKLVEENTAANRELTAAITQVRSRRLARAAAKEPELPAGHRYGSAPVPCTEAIEYQVEIVRERLQYGWSGHVPPRPKPPGYAEPLPRLVFWRSVYELLASMTADELLVAVDEVAELVEAGVLPPSDWTATRIFSGWLPGMRIKHAEWKRDRGAAEVRARENERAAGDTPAAGAPITPELAAAAQRRFSREAQS